MGSETVYDNPTVLAKGLNVLIFRVQEFMLNNSFSKYIKMAKWCAFGTSYGITHSNNGIKDYVLVLGRRVPIYAMFSVLSYQPLDKANSYWPVC